MTILLTGCPRCKENFMMADTEELEGSCILCGCIRKFTKEEMSEAESRRDRLSEEYIPRMQRAYEDGDVESMSALAQEAAVKGVSSWYAWFFIGWCHMSEGKVDKAFDDFELAVAFLDEESFDEFYDLVTGACIDSMMRFCKEGETWSGDCASMMGFAATLEDRFGEIMEKGFEEDLVTRVGFLDEEADDEIACLHLAIEAANIAICYSCEDLYIPNPLPVLGGASWAVDVMAEKAGKIGAKRNTMAMYPILKEFLNRVLKLESDIEADFGEDRIRDLSDHWSRDVDDDHEAHLQDAYECLSAYMVSSGRNKGQKKKMEAALSEYDKAVRDALSDEDLGRDEDAGYDFDGEECPDCGKYIKSADGVLECECGFKGRIVTPRIEELPEDRGELLAMAEKALGGTDSEFLFDLGSRILEDGDEAVGYLAVARSAALDDMLAECMDALIAGSMSLSSAKGRMYYDNALSIVSEGISGAVRYNGLLTTILIPTLMASLDRVEGGRFLYDLMERLEELDGMRSIVSAALLPGCILMLMVAHMEENTSLESWKELCGKCVPFLEFCGSKVRGLPNEPEAAQTSEDIARTTEVVRHLLSGVESKMAYAGPAAVKRLEKEWRGKDVRGLFSDVIIKSIWSEAKGRSDSREMLDATNAVDAALVAYMRGPASE